MDFPFELRTDARFDVVGFGTNAVDYLITVPHYPGFDSKVELVDYVQAAGGEVATTLTGLQRLGMQTAYIGRFGDDAAGEFGIEVLRKDGVDTDAAEVIPGAATQIAFILIDEKSGERTVIWKRDSKLAYTKDEVDQELVTSARVVHFTPHDTEACIEIARLAQDSGTVVSIDIDRVFEGVEELLLSVDILVCSAEFPKELIGEEDPKTALAALNRNFGCAVTGMTLGAEGSLLFAKDEYVRTPGYKVPGVCRDTTGAGDSFRTGLLYGLLKSWSVDDAARAANAVAALKCREIGARTALPNEKELLDFIRSGA